MRSGDLCEFERKTDFAVIEYKGAAFANEMALHIYQILNKECV